MENFTVFLNFVTGLGTVLCLLLGIIGILLYFFSKEAKLFAAIKKNVTWIGFAILFAAVAGSILYSNVIGYPPCDLCWWQRIFMYSTFVLFFTALIRKEKIILPYANVLIALGGIIALYHSLTYYTGVSPLPCSATVSCLAHYVNQFGFVSIPLMSFSIFFLLFALILLSKKADKISLS